MALHDDLLAFMDDIAGKFDGFGVMAVNQKASDQRTLPIAEIIADDSDNEICLVRAINPQINAGMNFDDFRKNLRATIEAHPDYSLAVSEWFEIDDEYTARADFPLQSVELNEETKQFLLLY